LRFDAAPNSGGISHAAPAPADHSIVISLLIQQRFLTDRKSKLCSDSHTQRFYTDTFCNPIETVGNIRYGLSQAFLTLRK